MSRAPKHAGGKPWAARRKPRGWGLQVPREVDNRRKKLQWRGTGADCAEGLRGRCDPGHDLHAHLQGAANDVGIEIGRNDEAAARRVGSADGVKIEYGTRPNEAIGTMRRHHGGHTSALTRRVERSFDDANTLSP